MKYATIKEKNEKQKVQEEMEGNKVEREKN